MFQITINGNPVPTRDGATIFEAAFEDKYARTQFDTDILSLHYLKGVQEKEDSGLCIVEVAGKGIVNACDTIVEPFMEVVTKSEGVRAKQKAVLEEISAHDKESGKRSI